MNVKPLILDKLQELSRDCTEYSFGQILYTLLRNVKNRPKNVDITWVRETSDNLFFTAVEKSLKTEKEENI